MLTKKEIASEIALCTKTIRDLTKNENVTTALNTHRLTIDWDEINKIELDAYKYLLGYYIENAKNYHSNLYPENEHDGK